VTTAKHFYERSQVWVDRLMETSPVTATQLGDHRYNDRLDDLSLGALEDRNREAKEMLAELDVMSTSDWASDEQIDHVLMTQLLKSAIRDFEMKREHQRNPGTYLDVATGGIVLLLMKEFAPLPDRLKLALERTKQIPRVLEEAKRNLIARGSSHVGRDAYGTSANGADAVQHASPFYGTTSGPGFGG
jgi:uncharacterized protein (DUF885 family)